MKTGFLFPSNLEAFPTIKAASLVRLQSLAVKLDVIVPYDCHRLVIEVNRITLAKFASIRTIFFCPNLTTMSHSDKIDCSSNNTCNALRSTK